MRDFKRPVDCSTVRFADGCALLRRPLADFQREASQQNNQDRRRAHAPASAGASQLLPRASLRQPR